MASELKIGSVFNFVGIAVRLLVGFTMTPYMLHCLGKNNFGLFSLAGSLLAYLALMDFGLSPTVTRYLAECVAKKEYEKESDLIAQSVYLFSLLGLLFAIGGAIVYQFLDSLYGAQLTPAEFSDLQWMYILMVANTSLFFPLRAFNGVVAAHQKYKIPGIIGLCSSALSVSATFLLLHWGYGPVALVLAGVVLGMLTAFWNMAYALHVLECPLRFPRPDFRMFKSMSKYAFGIFIPQICDVINWQLAPVCLGAISGLAAVSVYRIGLQIPNIFMSLPFAISSVFFAKIVGMVTQGTSTDVLVRLMAKVSRIQSFMVFICLIGFTLFGYEFLTLYVGKSLQDQVGSAWWISVILMFCTSLPLLMTLSGPIIQAYVLNYRRAYIILAIMPLTFLVGIVLSYPLQGIGFALATGGCSAVLGSLLVNRLILKNRLGLDLSTFFSLLFHKTWLPLCVTVLFGAVMQVLSISMNASWGWLTLKCVCTTIVYVVLMWKLWANDEEKQILLDLLRRFYRRTDIAKE